MKILLIEDDAMIGASLKQGLAMAGFSPEWVTDLESAQAALHDLSGLEALVLDLNLPDGNGMQLLKQLREIRKSDIPVLLLTAQSLASTKVQALDLGADDYVSKPFDLAELAARLRAIIRRRHGHQDSILESSHIKLNTATGLVNGTQGEGFHPTAQELKLLTLLMQRPGKVVSKSQIEEALYGWDQGAESNIVEVAVYNLRKRLGREAIITLRGIGYMVAP